jgi:hypothetical protein
MRIIYADCEWNPYDVTRDILIVGIHNGQVNKFYSFIDFFQYCNTEPTTIVGYSFSAWRPINTNKIGDINRYILAYEVYIRYNVEYVNRVKWYVYDYVPDYPNIHLLDLALLLTKRYPKIGKTLRSLKFWCDYLELSNKNEVTLDEIRDYFTKSENKDKIELYCIKDTQLVKDIFDRISGCF